MSLYDRLDLTRPNRKLKSPIWERLDLSRPQKLRCWQCRADIQIGWEFCPTCGGALSQTDTEKKNNRHCVWVDLSGISFPLHHRGVMAEVIVDAFSKVFGAFRGVKLFLTSEQPEERKWGNTFTHIYVCTGHESVQSVNYLGAASFKLGMVTNHAIIHLDRVYEASERIGLDAGQLSNLIANTIAHEIGHTLGLDHSALPTDVMHDGLDYTIHSMMPPSFHAEQINFMNRAIRQYKL
ncbi:MAG: Matrixin [Phormidium sp. OSCR]|nr:MAG: Matrixin [Phormidium sp. OSCR]